MAIRTYRLIIILNISRLNASTKKHKQTKWVQKQDLLPTKDSQIQKYIQTETEGREKGISHKQKSKESQRGNTSIRQNRLENKRLLRETKKDTTYDQRINPRIYNTCKYICTQQKSTSTYIWQILTEINGEINSNPILTLMDRSSRQKKKHKP